MRSILKKCWDYFIHHWKGELSLAQSFWINFLAVLIVPALLHDLILLYSSDDTKLSSNAIFQILPFIIIPMYVWQITGVWRSAEKWEMRHYGRRLDIFSLKSTGWGEVAKIIVILVTVGIIISKPRIFIIAFPDYLLVFIGLIFIRLILCLFRRKVDMT